MARKVRIEYPGAIYHVMNRGDRKERIFLDDSDRQRFLDTLGEACEKTGWLVQAYCLMPNHFHLVMETPQPNLVAGMKWFLGTYTGRFNRRHQMVGHLFSGRYKALVVDGSGNGYLKSVCDYVHLNPSRAKLLKPQEPLRNYRWSSWPDYMKPPKMRAPWLKVGRLLGEYRMTKDSAAGRRQMEHWLERRRAEETGVDYSSIRRGWCFGGEAFRQELLKDVGEALGREHYGKERKESQEEQAEELVREELRRRGLQEEDLRTRKKGDEVKVQIARRLRQRTVMTVRWIAERLSMGSPSHVTNRLRLSSEKQGSSRKSNQ